MLGIRLLGRHPLGRKKKNAHYAAIYLAHFCGLLQTGHSGKKFRATKCHLTDDVAIYRVYMLGIYLGHRCGLLYFRTNVGSYVFREN
jgi:hypothetical protein